VRQHGTGGGLRGDEGGDRNDRGALKKIAYKDQRDAGFLSVTGWLMGKVLERG
jgi:hypothetical protein